VNVKKILQLPYKEWEW